MQLSVEDQLKLVRNNPYSIRDIEDPAEETQILAIQEGGHVVFRYIDKNASEAVLMEMVVINPEIILEYNCSKKVKMEGLKYNPFLIRYIIHPDNDMKLLVLYQNFATLNYVKMSDELFINFDITNVRNPTNIKYIGMSEIRTFIQYYIRNGKPLQQLLDFLDDDETLVNYTNSYNTQHCLKFKKIKSARK